MCRFLIRVAVFSYKIGWVFLKVLIRQNTTNLKYTASEGRLFSNYQITEEEYSVFSRTKNPRLSLGESRVYLSKSRG